MKIDLRQILPKEHFSTSARKWLDALKAERSRLQRALKKPLTGRIRETKDQIGVSRFYLVTGDNPNGKYVSSENIGEIEAIAQRDYNKKILAAIEANIKLLEPVLAKFCAGNSSDTPTRNLSDKIINVYSNLKPGRKCMVQPIAISDEDYAAVWSSLPYKGKSFEPGATEIFSASGLRVRSKSEAIIADILADASVPFRYEFPVNVRGAGTFHPDFYCLNPHSREEFIWEHFGMMSDCDYAENATGKISLYAKAGWTLGCNLLATFESTAQPLNSKAVKQTLLQFLGSSAEQHKSFSISAIQDYSLH